MEAKTNTNESPSRIERHERVREPARGSVGLMLGFVGGALGVFILTLGAVCLAFLLYFFYELFFYYNG